MNVDEKGHGYPISITGRHVLVTEAMKEYANDKISKLDHLSKSVMDVHVTMDIQRQEHRVDIMIQAGRFVIKTHASTPDMYASIDKAIEKLTARLSKYKSKMQEHHAKALSVVDLEINVVKGAFNEVAEINDAIDEANQKEIESEYSHHIVSAKTIPLKTLTEDEAVMKMDLSGDKFMLFRSEEDQKIKVIFRRTNGDYGLVCPE
ncbi:MAG: Ribosome hibernation promotion factor [Chlamydiae bacterium]|nr:Ribosome hibernation promotion factor [Chlamydiota bacterium]